MTYDRMAKWGSYDMYVFALCMNEAETHDHLVFYYQFSTAVWDSLKNMMNMQIMACKWNETITYIADKPCNNNIWSIIRRLSFIRALGVAAHTPANFDVAHQVAPPRCSWIDKLVNLQREFGSE